jgi:excisionase family DNA binding protein
MQKKESNAVKEALTKMQAARLLNVSQTHLVKLLKEGKIPHHKVGSHPRVHRSDVLAYKNAQRAQANGALQALNVFGRNGDNLAPGGTGGQFHVEPGLELRLFTPKVRHLGAGIQGDRIFSND